MNVSLLKIFDESILPAVLVIFAKILGSIFANYYFNLNWNLGEGLIFYSFPRIVYLDSNSLQIANSVSTLAVLFVLVFGFGFVLFRAHNFHDSHIHPKVSAGLHRRGLEELICDSYEIYHQAAIWLSLTWLVFLLAALQFSVGVLNGGIFAFSGVITLSLNALLFLDVKKEINVERELARQDVN